MEDLPTEGGTLVEHGAELPAIHYRDNNVGGGGDRGIARLVEKQCLLAHDGACGERGNSNTIALDQQLARDQQNCLAAEVALAYEHFAPRQVERGRQSLERPLFAAREVEHPGQF